MHTRIVITFNVGLTQLVNVELTRVSSLIDSKYICLINSKKTIVNMTIL